MSVSAKPTTPPAAQPRAHPDTLPDCRNLGVMLRVLVLVNAGALLMAVARSNSLGDIVVRMAEISAWLEPPLIGMLILLNVFSKPLRRLPYWPGLAAVVALSALLAAGLALLQRRFGRDVPMLMPALDSAWAGVVTLLLAGYFRLRDRAFSPAVGEARLQALQARIRPHFLFNSINAVLSLLRSDPRRAEGALEDLSELFRSLMADNRALRPFGEEVALTRQYLSLEQLRLGDRLAVTWKVDPRAEAAMVPPLFLQPLVENAVYHGIELGVGPGNIDISAEVRGEELRLVLGNPYHPDYQHRQGNRMALDNIRERLQLHFDVDARMETKATDGRFEIRIAIPFRKESRASRAAEGGKAA